MITPIQESRTSAATHFALIGASSPAFVFQTPFAREKYRMAMPPIAMNAIFGANVVSFK